MRLITLGLNHATAPLALRERVAIPSEQLAATLAALTERFAPDLRHVLVLSTCNRTEIYAATGRSSEALPGLRDALAQWLAARHDTPAGSLDAHWYWHVDDRALRHACRVACGLDSMVIGEPQILGQMKEAARQSDALGLLGTPLRQAFDRSFAVAKAVRSTTAIGAASVSMAAAAVRLSERIFERLSAQRVLFIGAGEMIELVATHFAAQRPASIAIANRSVDRAQRLATTLAKTGVETSAMLLSDLPQQLSRYDIVVSSTASTLPLLGLGMVERALKQRKRKPIFMVDLGVPRDIEREVGELDDVYLYTIDDLGEVVSSGYEKRRAAVDEAEAIIDREVAAFMRWLDARDQVPVIRDLHQRGDAFRAAELDRARRRLAKGDDPNVVIEALAQGITNKFLHGPTQLLHRGARRGPRAPARIPAATVRRRRPRMTAARPARMKPSLAAKLDQLTTRRAELERLLSDPDATADLDRYRSLTREHAELGPLVESHAAYRAALADEHAAGEMASDPAMKEFADEELAAARARIATLDATLQRLLLPKDPDDARPMFLEIRAGTGGDESALFAGDLLRMYLRFAERNAGRSRWCRRRRRSSAATRK